MMIQNNIGKLYPQAKNSIIVCLYYKNLKIATTFFYC